MKLNVIKCLCLTEICNLSVNYNTAGQIPSKQLFRSLTVKCKHQQKIQMHLGTNGFHDYCNTRCAEKRAKSASSDTVILHVIRKAQILAKTHNAQNFCCLVWSFKASKEQHPKLDYDLSLRTSFPVYYGRITLAFNVILDYSDDNYGNLKGTTAPVVTSVPHHEDGGDVKV
jgi:hypothetical protein